MYSSLYPCWSRRHRLPYTNASLLNSLHNSLRYILFWWLVQRLTTLNWSDWVLLVSFFFIMLTTFFDILVFIFLIVFFWTACIKNICREIISKYNFTTTKKCTSPNLATLDCSRSCVGSGVRARELNIHCSDTSERPISQISWFAVFTVHCGARGDAWYIRAWPDSSETNKQ